MESYADFILSQVAYLEARREEERHEEEVLSNVSG